MFTGQYSTENGMWRGPGKQPLGSPGYRGIKRDVKMLSEHLAEVGYKTGAFGNWHLGALKGKFRTTQQTVAHVSGKGIKNAYVFNVGTDSVGRWCPFGSRSGV